MSAIGTGRRMSYADTSANSRKYLPPAVAVSTVAFALRVPAGARAGGASDAPGRPCVEVPQAGDRRTGQSGRTFWIPLVRRIRAPFLGLWALPGGPTEWDETLADTALRTLRAAARRDPGYVEQLYSFGGVQRSAQAQRLVTIAYWALYGEHDLEAPSPPEGTDRRAASDPGPRSDAAAVDPHHDPGPEPRSGAADSDPDAVRTPRWDDPVAPPARIAAVEPAARVVSDEDPEANVAWFSADALPELAFDHAEIIAYALERLRSKTEYASVAHRFLGETFTLGSLRAVHEAVLGETVDPANFRRQALAQGNLIDTGELETGTRHRPARLYRFRGTDENETRGTRAGR